jgi:hypothetical protein
VLTCKTSRVMRRIQLSGLILCIVATGCTDLRGFAGSWSGAVLEEEAIRQGFTLETSVESLTLNNVDVHGMRASLTTSDGRFKDTPLTLIRKVGGDALSSLTFDGHPLRSYFFFAAPNEETPAGNAMIIISLFGDEHIEMRVIRGNDLFGVFLLNRQLL